MSRPELKQKHRIIEYYLHEIFKKADANLKESLTAFVNRNNQLHGTSASGFIYNNKFVGFGNTPNLKYVPVLHSDLMDSYKELLQLEQLTMGARYNYVKGYLITVCTHALTERDFCRLLPEALHETTQRLTTRGVFYDDTYSLPDHEIDSLIATHGKYLNMIKMQLAQDLLT